MHRRMTLRPLAIALALLVLSPLVVAQYGLSNPLIGLKTAPPITKSDIRIIDSILGLDESQRSLTGRSTTTSSSVTASRPMRSKPNSPR
ncbi:MAG: hypothetical protein ACFHWZ_05715 [Phycisphaerales bacterium]